MMNKLKDVILSWWWTLPVMLAVAFVGAAGLDADMLWTDEIHMLNDLRVDTSIFGVVQNLSDTNPWHVPGYFIVVSLWQRLFDWMWAPFLMRVPALFAGMLALAFAYRFGRDHFSTRVGLMMTLIIAVSNLFIIFLHEARMYSTNIMLTAFLMWWYLRIIDARKTITWKSYALLLLGFIGAIYTHYFMLTVLAGIGIFHLIAAPKNGRYWRVIGVGGVALLSFIPWVFTLIRVLERMSTTTIPNTYTLNRLFIEVGRVFSHGYTPLLLVIMGVSLVAFRYLEQRSRFNFLATWSVLVIAVVIIIAGHEAIGIVAPDRVRYLVLLLPLFAVIISISFVMLSNLVPQVPILPAIAIAVWCVLAIHSHMTLRVTSGIHSTRVTYPLHYVVRALEPVHETADLAIHILPRSALWQLYYQVDVMNVYNDLEGLALSSVTLHASDPPSQVDVTVEQIGHIGDVPRKNIWVGYLPENQALADTVRDAIVAQTDYNACQSSLQANGTLINQFTRHPVCCSVDAQGAEPLVRYDTLAMSDVGVEMSDDDDLAVWVATATDSDYVPESYSVGVYVVAEDASVPLQVDYGLPVDDFACRENVLSTADLSDGEYRIVTSVYDWRTGQRIVGEGGVELPEVGAFVIEDGIMTLSSADS